MEAVDLRRGLLKCPPEVRLMIWENIFRSKTGKIRHACRRFIVADESIPDDTTRWRSVSGNVVKMDDSVMSTCKLIYAETRSLLWELNTFVIDTWYLNRCCDIHKISFWKQVVHVQLDVGILDSLELPVLSKSLEVLKSSAKHGKLKTISFRLASGLVNVLEIGSLEPRGMLEPFVDWFSAARASFAETQVKFKMELETGWHLLSPKSQVYFRRSTEKDFLVEDRKLDSTVFNPVLENLKALHVALGGQLWQDNTLCYENGKEICEPFKLQPGVEQEVNDLDRVLINDAIKRRALCLANATRSNRWSRCYQHALREQYATSPLPDVKNVPLPPGFMVDYRENWHNSVNGTWGLRLFASHEHPVFAISNEECYKLKLAKERQARTQTRVFLR